MTIGARIRASRKAEGLSQEGLARRADTSLNVISRLERGEIGDPHVSTLTRIADALGTTVSELLSEEVALAGKDDAPKTARKPLDIATLKLKSEPGRRFNIMEIQPVLAALEQNYGLPECGLEIAIVEKDTEAKHTEAKRTGAKRAREPRPAGA